MPFILQELYLKLEAADQQEVNKKNFPAHFLKRR